MTGNQLDEKVKKKKASLINTLTERKEKPSMVEAIHAKTEVTEKSVKEEAKKKKRKRKLSGLMLDPVVKDRLAAMAMVEEKNMSDIVEELINQLFEMKWSEWDDATRKFLLKKFPEIAP
ncbi:hypothetical protein [Archaeoglobus sp.]